MSQISFWLFLLFLLFILLMLSSFFSGSEAALMSLNRLRILFLAHQHHRRAQVINQLLQRKKRVISTILVGNNFVNVAASSVATALAISLWGKSGILYATIFITLILLIFCEILPKVYAAKFPEKISFVAAKPILWLMRLLRPLVGVIDSVVDFFLVFVIPTEDHKKPLISEEEIQAVITIGEKEGVVEKEERKMLLSIFDLADTPVREIMVPRTEMVCIEENSSYAKVNHIIDQSGRSRFPVFRGDIDNIIGTIHSRDLLKFQGNPASFSLAGIMHPAFFIPESMKVLSLLADFKKKKIHLAMVIDEYGGIEGLVTLEDVLEEIVGDILDESDLEEKWIEYLPNGRIMVNGDTSIREINRYLHLDIPHDEFQTLSGFILDRLGVIPHRGESISYEGYQFTVYSIFGQKISKVEIKLLNQ
ncbi:MAG: HlyC/CorC family transporter [bacterium]